MTHLAALPPPVAPIERWRFTITQDERGLWVAREKHGLIEGVFVDQRAAIRFALYECGRRGFCSAVVDVRTNRRDDMPPSATVLDHPARTRATG